MKSVDKRTFPVAAHRVWEIIREPGNQPAWNPKCVQAENIGTAAVGRKFAVTYRWKDKEMKATGEVLEIQPETRIVFRYHYEDGPMAGSADEEFELIEEGMDRTTLVKTIHFKLSGIPKWAQILMGLISRFGKHVGPGEPLDGLDDLLS